MEKWSGLSDISNPSKRNDTYGTFLWKYSVTNAEQLMKSQRAYSGNRRLHAMRESGPTHDWRTLLRCTEGSFISGDVERWPDVPRTPRAIVLDLEVSGDFIYE